MVQAWGKVLMAAWDQNPGLLDPELSPWLNGKEFACSAGAAGDKDSIPASGRSPGEGNGNLLQYSCLGNCMDRGAWRVIVHRDAKSCA